MEEGSKEKTAFSSHRGHFQYRVMPFGLSTAPQAFQRLMNLVLEGLEDFAVAYLDDILIFSANEEEHLKHIQTVLNRLREHNLKLKLKKCEFMKEETEYLGFIVSKNGVKTDPKKVEAINTMAAPKSVREVRGFIGMTSYYRRFIPNFSAIAEPLLILTKKYARFSWSEEAQKAFDFIKESLMVVPLLVYPDLNKPYVLYTDASQYCIGACLTQEVDGEEKPIYFLSHKLTPTQTRWPTIEKEAYAIHYSVQKLNHYLHDATFVIRTDHKPLKYILDSPMNNKKVQLWALILAGYNCKVEYIEGRLNCCADLLSRLPTGEDSNLESARDTDELEVDLDLDDRTLQVSVLNSNTFVPKEFAKCELQEHEDLVKPFVDLPEDINILKEQNSDSTLSELKSRIETGKATKTESEKYLETGDGLTYYLSYADSEFPRMRLYIPETLEGLVIRQHHEGLGHLSVDKTYDAIRPKYFFPNMFRKLIKYVEGCVTCQARASANIKPPMQEMDRQPYPFAKIALDLSGPYPPTLSGNKYIVSFIDMYSGWPECFPVPDKGADNIVHLLLEEIFPRFGCPLQLLTDNGTENVNFKVRETLDTLNIHHITTSFYSPQANGKVERLHRSLHDIMSKKVKSEVNTWDLYLNQTLAALRFHTSDATGFSPFFLVYGRDVTLPLDTILNPRRRYMGEDQHKIALEQQHKAFFIVHHQMKKDSEARRAKTGNGKDPEIQVGSPVYLRNFLRKNKLDDKWVPYYRVIEQTGPVSYLLKNQLSGTTVKAHGRHLKLAKLDWQVPETNREGLRRARLAVVPDEADEQPEKPCRRNIAIERRRVEREDSSDEEDLIPLSELQRRLRARELDRREADVMIPVVQAKYHLEGGVGNVYEP